MALGQDTIAESQANKHTTANDAVEQIARKTYDHLEVEVDDSNAITLTTEEVQRHGTVVLIDGSPVPDGAITMNLPAEEIGGFMLRNATSFTATIQKVSGQSETAPTVAAGAIQQFAMDGSNVRAVGAAGGAPSVFDRGTITTGTETPEWADGEMQKGVNGGAHILAAMTGIGYYVLTYINGAAAGIITPTGWDSVNDAGTALSHTVENSVIECSAYNDGVSKRLIVTLIEDATP